MMMQRAYFIWARAKADWLDQMIQVPALRFGGWQLWRHYLPFPLCVDTGRS